MARAAMKSLDGIDELHMSGRRAVFTLEKGARLSEDEIAEAFEDQGMKLVSHETVERPRVGARYRVDAGIT